MILCSKPLYYINASVLLGFLPLRKTGSLNGNNADMCSDVAGPSCSSSVDLFELFR